MPELRQNPITKDWVIFATERAKRPHEFIKPSHNNDKIPTHKADCPFCLGNEADLNLETFCLRSGDLWRVRVVPNKYPALSAVGDRTRKVEGIHRIISGVGIHEVVVEHPQHDLTPALMTIVDVENILIAYRQRYIDIRKDPRIEAIIIFKNHGESAGTSIEHSHSQIAAIPVVPHQFRVRIDEAIRYCDDDTGECIFCRNLQEELDAQERIVLESEHFVAFIPYAALSPFHLWIYPRRHASSFDDITDAELADLAYTLKTVLAKLYHGLNNPDYNYTIRSIPTDETYTDYFHWYLAIVPRVSKSAGFEIGSGMYINTSMPEDSAKFLRDVEIPD
jgi:UDPglucose--hexose-1-phosphate uridylyltransferase